MPDEAPEQRSLTTINDLIARKVAEGVLRLLEEEEPSISILNLAKGVLHSSGYYGKVVDDEELDFEEYVEGIPDDEDILGDYEDTDEDDEGADG